MIPLYDQEAPAIEPPYVTFAIIGFCLVVFFGTYFSSAFQDIIWKFGLIPNIILGGQGFLTLLTNFFLHGGWQHVLLNIWVLWIFGNNVEYNMGKLRFFLFFIFVGLTASLLHVLMAPVEHQGGPAIGASGAIFGVMGAYLILFPKNKIRGVMFWPPFYFNVPAFIYMGIYFALQFLYINEITSIAYTAHIGGFIAGIIFGLVFKRKVLRKDYVVAAPALSAAPVKN